MFELKTTNLTMTSREIAELTGKDHRNVLRDARAMLLELHGEEGLLRFEQTHYVPQNGQRYPVLAMPKRESLILVSGYSVTMRARIIDRWQELESGAAAIPKTLPDALRMAADLVEQKSKAEAALAEAQPKVEFHDAVVADSDEMTMQDAAKILGTGGNRLFRFLRDRRVLRPNNLPYQRHINDGNFVVRVAYFLQPDGREIPKSRTFVTGKGLVFLFKQLRLSADGRALFAEEGSPPLHQARLPDAGHHGSTVGVPSGD